MENIPVKRLMGHTGDMTEVKLSDVFSRGYISSLESVSGFSLDDCFDDLLKAADRVVTGRGLSCKSEFGKSAVMTQDVEIFGVDAVVDARGLGVTVSGLDMAVMDHYISVREMVPISAISAVSVDGVGMRVVPTRVGVGNKLVVDRCVDPMVAVGKIRRCWDQLMENKARVRESLRADCACVSKFPCGSYGPQWLLSCGDTTVVDLKTDLFEVKPGKSIQRHQAGLCDHFGIPNDPRSYLVNFEGLLASIRVSFGRFLHELGTWCCTAEASSWRCGVRRVVGQGWLLADLFICDGAWVTSESGSLMNVMRSSGLVRKRRGQRDWFLLNSGVLKLLRRSLRTGKPIGIQIDRHSKSVGLDLLVRALEAWLQYCDHGTLVLADVIMACGVGVDGSKLKFGGTEVVCAVEVYTTHVV